MSLSVVLTNVAPVLTSALTKLVVYVIMVNVLVAIGSDDLVTVYVHKENTTTARNASCLLDL